VIAMTVERDVPTPCPQAGKYWIRLKIAQAAREDAWELCQAAARYGGVEVHRCCFAFADEEHWTAALESLRFQFGREYFEPFRATENEAHGPLEAARRRLLRGRTRADRP